MKNLVCNEKFGINCASAEAQFGTGRGITPQSVFLVVIIRLVKFQIVLWCLSQIPNAYDSYEVLTSEVKAAGLLASFLSHCADHFLCEPIFDIYIFCAAAASKNVRWCRFGTQCNANGASKVSYPSILALECPIPNPDPSLHKSQRRKNRTHGN